MIVWAAALAACDRAVESMPTLKYCALVQGGQEAEFFDRMVDAAHERADDVATRLTDGHRPYLLRFLWVDAPDYVLISSNDAVNAIYDLSFHDYEGQTYLRSEAGRAATAEFVDSVSELTVRTRLMDDTAARCDLAF